MTTDLTFLKPLVERVLRDPQAKWSVQGFGFLRTYFGPAETPKRFRLNLWHSGFTVPNVSTIHDHPWSFKSIIIAGSFCNLRYDMTTDGLDNAHPTHLFTTIKTGPGGGIVRSDAQPCILTPHRPEIYTPGDEYAQAADEIHETLFADGSVTLNERIGDTEHARVFWPANQEWVDAEPRDADRHEVSTAVSETLKRWF